MGFERWPEKQGAVVKTGASASRTLATAIIKNRGKEAYYLDPEDKRQYPKLVQALRFQGYKCIKRENNGRPYIDIEPMTQPEKDRLRATVEKLKEQAKKYRQEKAASIGLVGARRS
jgi:hypothetical protein